MLGRFKHLCKLLLSTDGCTEYNVQQDSEAVSEHGGKENSDGLMMTAQYLSVSLTIAVHLTAI